MAFSSNNRIKEKEKFKNSLWTFDFLNYACNSITEFNAMFCSWPLRPKHAEKSEKMHNVSLFIEEVGHYCSWEFH